jgi:hypothetical protein
LNVTLALPIDVLAVAPLPGLLDFTLTCAKAAVATRAAAAIATTRVTSRRIRIVLLSRIAAEHRAAYRPGAHPSSGQRLRVRVEA